MSATYLYNNYRRLVTSINYSAQSTANLTFGYDAAGNRTSMTDGLGTKSYSYNQLSQLTSETRTFDGLGTYSLGYDYNLAGELKTLTSPFSETLNYGFDSIGRLQNINASGYYASQFLNSAQYRAWGTLKSATYGNGVVESAAYNGRMQMISRQVQKTNNQPGASSTYQYYADGGLQFSHSLDDRFDRAFSYDNAERVSEAYSGSEARDFINNTNSGTPTGPYRQGYQYDAFDEISQQTNRIWSQTQTANNTFVNHRLQGWSYDADGGLTSDGTNTYGRDAAGMLVTSGTSASYDSNKYDGDGRITRTSIRYQNGSETFIHYYLNSSVLGLAVSKLDSNGNRVESYVYAGGNKIATASPQQSVWVHEDPVTGSHGFSMVGGLYGADAEFNADRVNVNFAEPTQPASDPIDFKYPEVAGSSDCYPGNPNCVACYVSTVEHDCREISGLLSQGFAQQCPDNDCGPRLRKDGTLTLPFQAFDDGYSGFLPQGTHYIGHGRYASPGPPGDRREGDDGMTFGGDLNVSGPQNSTYKSWQISHAVEHCTQMFGVITTSIIPTVPGTPGEFRGTGGNLTSGDVIVNEPGSYDSKKLNALGIKFGAPPDTPGMGTPGLEIPYQYKGKDTGYSPYRNFTATDAERFKNAIPGVPQFESVQIWELGNSLSDINNVEPKKGEEPGKTMARCVRSFLQKGG